MKKAVTKKVKELSDKNERLKFALEQLEISKIELEAQNKELVASREAVNQSNDRYRDLYDFAPIGYMTLTKTGLITDVNFTASKLLGTERCRLLGHTMIHFVEGKCRRDFSNHLLQCREGEKHLSLEVELRHNNTPVQLCSIWAKDVITREPIIRMAIIDLTEKKRAEEERDRLAWRIQEELEQKTSRAEHANESKSAFLANMSHEIRTPLAAILGFTEQLQKTADRELRIKFGNVIARNGNVLTKLIDDILDLSKVEAGRIELEKIDFNVGTLIDEVLSLFQEPALKKGISLVTNADTLSSTWVNSDPTRIRQILLNLVGNAVKFTSHGKVEVETQALYEGDEIIGLEFTIRDSGVGMTKAQMGSIFEPFSQADSATTRKFGGTGLGLGLSRRLARALRGDVCIVQSRLGGGSTFVATVKVAGANAPSEKLKVTKTNKVKSSPERIKVLLVEDSPDNQDLVSMILEHEGIVVDIAENGAIGIDMAENANYDVVLMDMQMPIVDGYEATARLRHDGYEKPIIALTAHAMVSDRDRILSLGCNAHLTKPLDSKLLIETVFEAAAASR